MAFYDLSREELERFRPPREEPVDFDAFWTATLADARRDDVALQRSPVERPFRQLVVEDLAFAGFGGDRIRGWFVAPRRPGPLPVVVTFIGYGGGRGLPVDWTQVAATGAAQLVMDTRGQGSRWRSGDTPDGDRTGPHGGGVMTLGIEDPAGYYYRRLLTDAVRAVDAARSHPLVDPDRVAVQGGSQGGGMALAVAGLVDGLAGVVADVPFLCGFRRAIGLTDSDPYGEIARYLRVHRDREEAVLRTLSYVDGINFAARATAPAMFSVGLMDLVCPPSTVYAAFNHYAGPKRIEVYPYNGHENGEEFQAMRSLEFLAELLRI